MSSKSQEQPKKSGYKFRASTFNLTPGYSIVSQHMYPVYTTTASDGTVRESSPDFGGEMGRVIYNTPSVSDTVYFKSPSNYIDDGGGGFMPIGADADQESAKSAFYKTVTTAKPENNEETKKAHRRAAVNKKSIGGTILKNAALVGSMFIPGGVGATIIGLNVLTQSAGILATIGKLFVGNNNEMLNNIQGWAKTVNRST